MPDRTRALDNEGMYHIYNRANGNELMFYNDSHYLKFLKYIEKYLVSKADIWTYCLMPNHFHILIEIRKGVDGSEVSKAISDMCNAYAKWLNINEHRKGNLFMRPFKRNKVNNDAHLAWIIWYIHRNPLHHGIVRNFNEWRFSSYNAIYSFGPLRPATQKIVEFFGGIDGYVNYHALQEQKYFFDGLD